MFPLSRIQLSKFAAVGSLFILSALGTPVSAEEPAENLGPVGPHEPILTTVGSQRVIAFYMPGSERCALHAVVWDKTDAETNNVVARVRVSLEPGQIVHIDSAENESLNLRCGSKAGSLAVVDQDELIAYGITTHKRPLAANASRF